MSASGFARPLASAPARPFVRHLRAVPSLPSSRRDASPPPGDVTPPIAIPVDVPLPAPLPASGTPREDCFDAGAAHAAGLAALDLSLVAARAEHAGEDGLAAELRALAAKYRKAEARLARSAALHTSWPAGSASFLEFNEESAAGAVGVRLPASLAQLVLHVMSDEG